MCGDRILGEQPIRGAGWDSEELLMEGRAEGASARAEGKQWGGSKQGRRIKASDEQANR